MSGFAARLWGDFYYDPESRTFGRKPQGERSFVHFILEPLYKVLGYSLGEEEGELRRTLAKIGVFLNKRHFKLDTKPLLQLVVHKWLGGLHPLIDAVAQHIPDPAASHKLERLYLPSSTHSAEASQLIANCEANGPLYVHIAKLVPRADCRGFDALARVMSGTLRKDDTVSVLGEDYSLEDPEDMALQKVSNIYLSMARYRVAVSEVRAGGWAIVEGVDRTLTKTGTLIAPLQLTAEGTVRAQPPISYLEPLRPLQF